MFTLEERDRVRDRIIEVAKADPRIVSGAMVGSLIGSSWGGDRWSDLDLTFALDDGVLLDEVLTDWTSPLAAEFGAVHLFDLPHLSTLYRVFLLRGNLQVDLSFTPKADFGGRGPKFKLLWGKAVETKWTPPPSAKELFGEAVHYLVRARICIERGKLWQAMYLINDARNFVLSLECVRRGLPALYGRGFDNLPKEFLQPFTETLVSSLDRHHLLNAMSRILDELLRNPRDVGDMASKLESQLREIQSETLGQDTGRERASVHLPKTNA